MNITTTTPTTNPLLPLLRTMRPRQWSKNIFVFAALVFDAQMTNLVAVGQTVATFALLCLMSSAVYVMNDLGDIENDRQHPVKRHRPLPAGELSPTVAKMAVWLLAGGSLLGAYLLSPALMLVLLAYFAIQVGYTFRLKHVVLLDVLLVAAGFGLRVAAGVVVIEVQRFSPWLYMCMVLLALFMALGKRRHELVLLGENAGIHRAILQEYTLDLIDKLIGTVTTSIIVAYSLYTFMADGLPPNNLMMLTIPFVMYAIFRYLYLIHVKNQGGAPEEIFLRDRPLQISMGLWGMVVVGVLYL